MRGFFPIPCLHWLRILFLTQAKIRVPKYNTQNFLSHPVTHHSLQTLTSLTSFRQTLLPSSLPSLLSTLCSILIFISFFHICHRGRSLEVWGSRLMKLPWCFINPVLNPEPSSSFLFLLFYPIRSKNLKGPTCALARPPHRPGLCSYSTGRAAPQQRSFTQCSPGIGADCFKQ